MRPPAKTCRTCVHLARIKGFPRHATVCTHDGASKPTHANSRGCSKHEERPRPRKETNK